jgi:hypothetical protein
LPRSGVCRSNADYSDADAAELPKLALPEEVTMLRRTGLAAAFAVLLAVLCSSHFKAEAVIFRPHFYSFAELSPASDPFEEILEKLRAPMAEERWRLIFWYDSLKKGFAVAAKLKKPVFFFGYDGTLDNGNC